MTEAPLDGGGAPAPVDTNALTAAPLHNNPIQVTMPEAKPAEPVVEKKVSAGDAIKAAQAKIEAKEAEAKAAKPEPAKVEAKPEARPETKTPPAEAPAKAQDAPGQQADVSQSEGKASRYEAPARFNDTGKAEWAKVPEPVQAEVHRTIKNLEDGYTKHKASAERYEQLKEYDELAKTNGRDLKDSLRTIKQFEDMMKGNPLDALNLALRESGPRKSDGSPLTIQDVAAHVMGQQPNQHLQQAQAKIHELETKIQQMERAAKAPDIVAEFAAKNPRFEELSDVIATLIKTGTAKDLETAYELASVLRPATASPAKAQEQVQASPAAETASPAPAIAKPAGQKSISGAPSSGATSGGKKRVLSASEALKAAMASA